MMDRRFFLQQGSLSLLLGVSELARGANIVALRIWPADDYTRVTIESDTALMVKSQTLTDPPRLAVDIEGLELIPALRQLIAKVQSDDPFIAGMRVGQYAPNVVRIVIDLKQDITPQVFALQPVNGAYGHRLVFDLYPAAPPDPLEQLIAEKISPTAPNTSPPDTTPDTLGHFLAKQQSAPAPATLPSTKPPAVATAPTSAPTSARVPATTPALRLGRTDRLIIIALDPGHGGEDPGAIGPNGTQEKDVVLQIALRLRERINAALTPVQQGGRAVMRAYMTRDADFFVPLHQRVQKARRVQADLFVSIHADAFITPQASGASVFALSRNGASSSAARWMADKENQADAVGGINVKSADANVQRALLDMSTTAQINDSLKLGNTLLGEIGNLGRLHKGSVEQAGFAVLKAPDIPSVLIETAFISNPAEEIKLASTAYQDQMADALMRGIERYFAKNPPLARSRSL